MSNRRPLVTDPNRSALMKRVRRSGTEPELQVAAILRELGLRMRRNVKGLPGTPDVANESKKIAIFEHECFWYGHRGCRFATTPKRNAAFWASRIEANRVRDRRKAWALRRDGVRVVTVWSCAPERVRSAISRLA